MRELPAGTVTFVFTDIEGSTRLLHELGAPAYADALAEHRRVVRHEIEAAGGVEIDTQGDAFFVAFSSASQALAAVRAIQQRLADGDVKARIGVHTGEALVTAEGYVGADVHRAARIAASAHGGQVVVSDSTRVLAGGTYELVDLGEHRFKDLAAPERVYQLGTDEFPPLRSLGRSNLPIAVTPFLGRADEVRAVADVLTSGTARVVTLTGPGGIGKTRLAIQAAAEAADAFPDGVWWVALSSVREPAALDDAIAGSLGCEPPALRARLADRRALILLDNIEQLLPEGALTVSGLAADAPRSTWLVTSREALRIGAEHEEPVAPLAAEDAEAMFVARAAARGVRVERTAALATLCRQLDGLPLAIELAAARAGVFSVEQLTARIGTRLDALRGARDADPRQSTLRATIDWSWSLLDPHAQECLARLSVFPNGARIEEAERVADADPDVLEALLDKSMLRRRTDADGAPRFLLLSVIRQYAAERLDELGQTGAVTDAHTQWVLDVLAEERGSPERPFHLCAPLRMWYQRDVEAALERIAASDPESLIELGFALFRVPGLLRRFEPMILAAGHSRGALMARSALATELVRDGDPDAAATIAAETLQAARDAHDDYATWQAGVSVLMAASRPGRLDEAPNRALIAELLAVPQIRDGLWPLEKGAVLQFAAVARSHAGDFAATERLFLEIHQLAGAGDDDAITLALMNAAEAALRQGGTERAARYLREALPIVTRTQRPIETSAALLNAATVAEDLRRHEDAARLFGAAGELDHELFDGVRDEADEALRAQNMAIVRGHLGPDAFAAAMADGARLGIEDALALARAIVADVDEAPEPPA